jgi:hypothetical protein
MFWRHPSITMNKSEVFDALLASLREELAKSIAASRDAAEYATNEEARAESKYDTQGLEASYLAAGQADHARQVAQAIELLSASRHRLLLPQDEVTLGSLVRCDLDGLEEMFFVAPAGGGEVVTVEGGEVTVVTLHSPVLLRMLGKRVGEGFSVGNGGGGSVLEIH